MIITAYRQLTKQEASGGPGFIPAVADCRYRAPLSPRLVRPCPTPQAASGRLLAYIIQHFPSRIKRLTIKFLYSFSQKGFTFFKVLLYYKINWKEWQSCTFSPIPLRARGSAGRAQGSVFCHIYNFILLYSSVPLLELLIWARSSVWESVRFASVRSRVRSPSGPPNQYNPNLYPIGDGFGFIVYIEEIVDW